MKTLRTIILLIGATIGLSTKAQIPNDSIAADFRCFIHLLEATHPDPYTNYGGKAFFHRAAHETYWSLRDDSVTTAEELCWRIRAFLAPLQDGHTQVHYPETQGSHSLVPIRFKAVGDGLFVRRLPKEHQHLIGSKLIAIENVQTKELCEEMMKMYPAENEIGKLSNICGHGHQPVVLGRIISELRSDTVTYHLMTPDGVSARLPLPLIPVEQWTEWNNENIEENQFPTKNLSFSFADKQKDIMYFRSTSIMARDNIEYMRQSGMDYYDDLRYCYEKVYHLPMPSDTLKAITCLPSFSEEFERMLQQMKRYKSEYLVIDLIPFYKIGDLKDINQ